MKHNILFFIPSFSSGGAEAFIVNLIEQLNPNQYQVTIICIDAVPGVYDDRLARAGVKIHTLINEPIGNPLIRYAKAYKIFKKFIKKNTGKFDVVHFNIAQGEDLPFIYIAKKAGVKVRILHSHNSSVNSRVKYIGHVLCKAVYKNDSTDYLACSDIAAKWLLPNNEYSKKNYKIIKNGIDVTKYRFRTDQRELKRAEIGLKDKPVFLNIGRLNNQKNQSFLIDAFQQIVKIYPEAVLLVAGEGELRRELELKTESCGLKDNIYWLGNRNDIAALLSAADVFLLPSLFEGLPYTIIEAQASGIMCVISDTISQECIVTDHVSSVKLDSEEFAKEAISAYRATNHHRADYANIVRKSGFDIYRTVHEMEIIYNSRRDV